MNVLFNCPTFSPYVNLIRFLATYISQSFIEILNGGKPFGMPLKNDSQVGDADLITVHGHSFSYTSSYRTTSNKHGSI